MPCAGNAPCQDRWPPSLCFVVESCTYASVIVAQLAGVAAAVAVGKWLWVSGRDGCRDLN
jgi:hypothetical protein